MKRKRNGLFYSKKEETINSISHGIGIAMGVIVSTLFLIKCYQAQNLWAVCGVWLYLFGMGGSYLASTLYHSLKHHNPWKRRLRHWDHAAIYWHIAGSYSPITLIALREDGGWGWELFGFVWLCAIIGTVVSFRKMEEHSYVETVCYILMGLSVLVVFKQLFALSPTAGGLASGDQVEILTSRSQNPQPEWLNFVTTARARARIDRSEERRVGKSVG